MASWDNHELKHGDYVIADHAIHDNHSGETFQVVDWFPNYFGEALIKVSDIANCHRTFLFYVHELSYEDGTRPNLSV